MDSKNQKSIIYKERIKNIFIKIYIFFLPLKKKKEIKKNNRLNIFNIINKEKRWGNENISGGGSTIEFTKHTREIIFKIISEYNIKSMLDAACGDFEWMPLLLQKLDGNFNYIGCDIVPTLIHQHKLSHSQYEFYHFDFVNDKLPICDLIFCRDALQHLPIDDIKKALNNFSKSGAKYLLTTTHIRYPQWKNKRDIRVGQCRDRNLLLEPFNLEDPLAIYSEKNIGHKFLGLWELPLKYNS
jgi:hypothetical protein